MFSFFAKLVSGLVALWIILSVLIAFVSMFVFCRLTDEELIATVYFESHDPSMPTHAATLIEANSDEAEEYLIYGDQWRIDAQFIKIRAWANIIGVNSRYELDRFQGRYRNIEDENNLPHKAYDLAEDKVIEIPQFLLDYNFLIDSEYGSSTYQDIDTSMSYVVYRTQSGIIVREDPLSVDR